MTEIEIKKKEELAEVFVEGQKLGSFNSQEIWDLSEQLRDFAISNSNDFKINPAQEITVGKCTFHVHPLNYPDFWNLVNKGNWEPETYAVFDRFIKSDTVFIDVGAWIGSTALYGAQLAAQTHAFEPDPIAFGELKANKEANREKAWYKNVHLHQKALAIKTGTANLGSKNSGGDSMSSVLFADEDKSWKVETIDLNNFLETKDLNEHPLFLKMDIEGGEYELVPTLKETLKKTKSALFLSLHPEFLLESIRSKTKGKFKEIKIRIEFYKKHKKLFKSLPYSKVTHTDGRPFQLKKQLAKALLLGNFPHTVLASN